MTRYQPPDVLTRYVLNPLLLLAVRLGASPRGAHMLEVPGRKSGKLQRVPVNPLALDGARYLVAPRGNTQWARNIRAAGAGTLRLGRHAERFRAIELDDAEKPPVLRAYLRNWSTETGKFFDGVTHESSVEELQRIAGEHPVFRIEAATE